jgi:hypothetical protein
MFKELESLLVNVGELSWLKKNLNSEENQSPLADLWWPYATGLGTFGYPFNLLELPGICAKVHAYRV